jgi:hypothetical protein
MEGADQVAADRNRRAFNVEQGITNELFPDERGEAGVLDPAPCHVTPSREDRFDVAAAAGFMRLLAPPSQAPNGYTSPPGR